MQPAARPLTRYFARQREAMREQLALEMEAERVRLEGALAEWAREFPSLCRREIEGGE